MDIDMLNKVNHSSQLGKVIAVDPSVVAKHVYEADSLLERYGWFQVTKLGV